MKLLKLSVIASAVLLSTGCASTGNMFSKVTNSVTSVVAPSEDEYVVEEPQLIGYEVVEMKNAKNSYSYPYGYYQAKPKYTTPNLGLSPGTEPGEYSIIGHDNRDLSNAAIGVKPGALIKPLP
jgi:hypothetical protein